MLRAKHSFPAHAYFQLLDFATSQFLGMAVTHGYIW